MFTLRGKSGGELLAIGAKGIVALVVAAYLGIQSLNFFQFTFPAKQQIYSYMGFGLTGGGLLAYILILKFGAKSSVERITSVVMIVICLVGELATAGFGMQVEAFRTMGIALTESELVTMIWIIRGLAFFHAFALIVMLVGEEFVSAFGKDGGAASVQSSNPISFPIRSSNAPVNEKENFIT